MIVLLMIEKFIQPEDGIQLPTYTSPQMVLMAA
jgi:hypothetical protein